MTTVKVHFEDDGQDVLEFTISFDDSYSLGQIVDSDMQQSIWTKFFVLSGKPKVGKYLNISEGPDKDVRVFKYKIVKVEKVLGCRLGGCENTRKVTAP